jgi:ionotropic glutamate receptor
MRELNYRASGNHRYDGFAVELIDLLAQNLEFNYTFQLQEDGSYGSLNKETGEWNGLIGEIVEGRVDLAITDLTITAERQSAVDFTEPWMYLGISIIFKKPKQIPSIIPYFLVPFSTELWIFIVLALVGVSLALLLIGRLSPCEWTNPHPCNKKPTFLKNQFTLKNAFWYCAIFLLSVHPN